MPIYPPSAIPPPRRILVRGVNWLGDAVMTTPALLRLREAEPDAQITLLTHEKLADLWLHYPAVDAVLTFSRRDTVWSVAKKLRAENFHIGLALPNSHRAALELWQARIPRRIGYAGSWRSLFLTQAIPKRSGAPEMRRRPVREIRGLIQRPVAARAEYPVLAHHMHNYLHLAATLHANPQPLPPRLFITGGEVEAVRGRFRLDPKRHWLGLNAGAEYGPAKRWPEENFVCVARAVVGRADWGVILLGGQPDAALAKEMEARLHQTPAGRTVPISTINLAGRTTLRELCAVLKLCRVVLTNDTGPMHVAAAVGTPVVAVGVNARLISAA